MDRELKKYLDDILNAIDEIESFVSQYPCRYDVFCATPILIRAVQNEYRNYWRSHKSDSQNQG